MDSCSVHTTDYIHFVFIYVHVHIIKIKLSFSSKKIITVTCNEVEQFQKYILLKLR